VKTRPCVWARCVFLLICSSASLFTVNTSVTTPSAGHRRPLLQDLCRRSCRNRAAAHLARSSSVPFQPRHGDEDPVQAWLLQVPVLRRPAMSPLSSASWSHAPPGDSSSSRSGQSSQPMSTVSSHHAPGWLPPSRDSTMARCSGGATSFVHVTAKHHEWAGSRVGTATTSSSTSSGAPTSARPRRPSATARPRRRCKEKLCCCEGCFLSLILGCITIYF
jgi:hypothetical protein